MLSNKIIIKESNKYKFNKDYETWGSKAGLTSKAVLTRPSKHRLTATSKAGLTHKRKKDTITKERGIGVDLIETIKKEFMYYYDQDVRQVRKNKYKNKVTEEAKSMLIAVAVLWDKMAKSATGEKEVPLLNIYYPIRKCWDKNPDWKYDDFKNLFSHFLNSKIPQEDKISFDLCLSEKYVARYKIAKKNKKETFAGIANELTL